MFFECRDSEPGCRASSEDEFKLFQCSPIFIGSGDSSHVSFASGLI